MARKKDKDQIKECHKYLIKEHPFDPVGNSDSIKGLTEE